MSILKNPTVHISAGAFPIDQQLGSGMCEAVLAEEKL